MTDASRLTASLADRYTIERELGRGGMATVYLARDLKHERQVALKVLRPDIGAALGAERFLLEIKTTANLRHPHILPLYDSGEAKVPNPAETSGPHSYLYYVMPLVEGETLRDRLTREKQLPIPDALAIAREVADALSYAHARGVIHRDIKPENILLEGGHAVVADFGIARALDAAGGDRLTMTGMSVGTPSYMSPEQAAGDPDLDGRSDLYSLACVLYEMLGGQAPFTGPTVESIVRQHMLTTAPPITNLRPAVSAPVADALARALAKSPADRFNPVAQFSTAIQSVGAHDAPAASRSPVAAPAPGARAGVPRIWWGVAAFAILVVGAVLVWRRGPTTGPTENASVAVLPFADLSPDRANEYFGDGIAETLIGALANVPGLDVAARTSAFSFRGKNVDVREIGRQLGVTAVLEGSVQRAGEKLRITAQLVKASNGVSLWSETFDRGAGDIFAVQDEVARAVVTALKGKLLAAQAPLPATAPTHDHEAYDLYLQGRFFWNKRAVADIDRAIGLFNQAIARDSNFAMAWSGLADAYLALPFYTTRPAAEMLRQSRAAVDRALALNPDMGEAHAALAYLLLHDWKWAASDSEFHRAIALSPGYATAHKWYADLLDIVGNHAKALGELQRAREIDPLSSIVLANLGSEYWQLGKSDSALIWLNKSLDLQPDMPLALENASVLYFSRGDSARFLAMRERLDVSSTRAGAPAAELRRAWATGGRVAVLRAQIASPRAQDIPFERARWRAQLGDIDGAFRDLDAAKAEHTIWMSYLTTFPDLAPIRKDPRFTALLQQMGLPATTLTQ